MDNILFKRDIFATLAARLAEPRRFIQVLAGPRQVGKTTLARQVAEELVTTTHYASADDPGLRDRTWLEQQWSIGRTLVNQNEQKVAVLILDEVQKIQAWSEIVKRLWDEDSANQTQLKVVLLGSAPLLIQHGLTESLAGRFELIAVPHWSFSEIRKAFGWDVDQFIYYGSYPGAASLISDESRWARYLIDSLIETTLSKDILLMTRVDKPALLRRLFQLGCDYSGQILSYQKMLGQLQDAGNTTTLAHYLDLLTGAGMITGLQKFAGQEVRQRGSSPKLQVFNTGLITSQSHIGFKEAKLQPDFWGRLVESAIGAHLINSKLGSAVQVFYWREKSREVDFIVKRGESLLAIEVKSGKRKDALMGMEAFDRAFHPSQKLLVGENGISLEDFLSTSVSAFFA